jgi:opacity protein-like surface antigen
MKRILLGLMLLLAVTAVQAQEVYRSSGRAGKSNFARDRKEGGFDPNRLIFGGGLALSFGDVTNIGISPVVGYKITDRVAAGIGLGYQYVRVKNFFAFQNASNPNATDYYDYKCSIFSPSVWARVLVWDNVFIHAEYENNYVSLTDYRYAPNGLDIESFKNRITIPALLAGVGYRQPIGENSSFVIMALYDVIQDKYSPYGNQINFRFGFNFGY